MVRTGEYISGSKLLPERILADKMGVSRNTIRLAIEELIAEGVVESKSRRGTYVTKGAWSNTNTGTSPDWPKYVKTRFIGIVPRDIPNISALYPGEEVSFVKQFFEHIGISKKEYHKLYSAEAKQAHGSASLRSAVAKHLNRYGIKAEASNVLITSSATQALYLLITAFLGIGSNFYYEQGSYINFRNLLAECGTNAIRLPMDDEGIIIDKLGKQALLQKRTILHVQPCNHHPTGITTSLKRRMEIIRLFSSRGIPIIEMDSMIDIYAEVENPPPLKALDRNNSVIFVGNMARATSEDINIAWMVADEYIINMLAAIKNSQDRHVNTTAQLITELSFTSGFYYEYMEQFRKFLMKRRGAYHNSMMKHLGDAAVWEAERSSHYFWPEFDKSVDIRALHRNLKEITFNPGYIYDPGDTRHISICTLAMPVKQFDAALAVLKKGIMKTSA